MRKQDEHAVCVIERGVERAMLGVSRLAQVREGIRSSILRQRSKIRDAAAYAKQNKIRWAGHVMRLDDNRWTRAVRSGFHWTSNAREEDRRLDGQTCSRSPLMKSFRAFHVFLVRYADTGQQSPATGTNGGITGTRSCNTMNNGDTGDTGEVFRKKPSPAS